MTDRVHAAIDGDLPRSALSDAELAELTELEDTTARAIERIRGASAPDLSELVLARIAVAPAPREAPFKRLARWFWAPRELTFTLRPAMGMAGLAAAMVTALLIGQAPAADPVLPPVVAATDPPTLYVQFRLEAPAASNVQLAGSFTEWRPGYALEETAPGVWSVMVPLEPGVHDYTFVVDGERWVVDPYAPRVADSFGGSNSRLFLTAPTDAA